MTTWIPSKFAKSSKIIGIKENNVWTENWTVVETYATTSKDRALLLERQHTKMCTMTDI